MTDRNVNSDLHVGPSKFARLDDSGLIFTRIANKPIRLWHFVEDQLMDSANEFDISWALMMIRFIPGSDNLLSLS